MNRSAIRFISTVLLSCLLFYRVGFGETCEPYFNGIPINTALNLRRLQGLVFHGC